MVNWGETFHRLDPSAYHPDCEAARQTISDMPYEKKSLGSIASFCRRIPIGNIYLGLEHVSSGNGIVESFGDASTMAAGVGFNKTDVLFPKLRPYLNKVWLADRNGLCSSEFHVLAAKNKITPGFLAIFLRSSFTVRQTSRLMTGTTLPRLQTSDIKRLSIPIPSTKIQSDVIQVWDTGLKTYKNKLAEAEFILASIDDYLLSELKISLPSIPKNSLQNRIFLSKANDLWGWRFDARVHQYDFDLISKKHPNARLATVCSINPKTIFKGITKADLVSFVPMDSISDRLGLISKKLTRSLAMNTGYTSFQNGDLLWAKITPCMENGKSAIADNLTNGFGYGSTEYHVLRTPNEQLDIGYLHALLRMKRVRKAAVRFFTGSSGHQRVDADFLKTLEIPIPSIDVQRALAAEACSRVNKAIELEKEANNELEKAKVEIEAILLGDVA